MEKAEETIEANVHQWVGYEVVSGEQHFYGVVQCGDWYDSEEEESSVTEDSALTEV